jgi:BirA family biotin operon repressor/biotin-[acetyl-CoA-carboxylase] ligase
MYIEETHSTNTLLREQYLNEDNLFTIRTDYQTAGRGQQGNGWESERGRNLLFSTLLQQPPVRVERQFRLTMAVSTAVCKAIRQVVPPLKNTLSVKWPNDIYAGDEKLAGILIENILSGNAIVHSIIGVGINLNQTSWTGNAPNPTSLMLQTGSATDPQTLLDAFLRFLPVQLAADNLRDEYMQHLYRYGGYHWYEPREVNTTPTMNATDISARAFEAMITDVTDSGELVLLLRTQEVRTYHFKQIRFVIP